MRASQHAVKVKGRLDSEDGLGEWQPDLDTAGDVTQWLCWPNAKGNGGRQIPGWAQVWPACIPGVAGGTPTQGGGGNPPPVPTGDNPGYPPTPTGGSGGLPVPTTDPNYSGDDSLGVSGPDGQLGALGPGGVPPPQIGGAAPVGKPVQGNSSSGYNGRLTVGFNSNPATINGQSIFNSGFARFTFNGSSSLSSLTGIPGVGFSGGFARFVDPKPPSSSPFGSTSSGRGSQGLGGIGGLNVHVDPTNPGGNEGPVGDPGLPGDPGPSAKHECGHMSGNHQLLPLIGEDMSPDKRFAPLTPITPSGNGIPKYSKGLYGLVVSSTNEEKQIEYFFPSWTGQLISVNQAGDPKMGTLVCDLKKSFDIDASRTAPLQSIMRVTKKPLGGANALGWNIDKTGCGDTRGGFVGEKPEGGGDDDYAYGLASYSDGGPLCVGSKTDKHRKGLDDDKNVINSLHIKTEALFRRNDVEDGPLRFEKIYKVGTEFDIPVAVHLAWTGRDWAWWTSSPIRYEPVPMPTPYPGIPGPNPPEYPTYPKVNIDPNGIGGGGGYPPVPTPGTISTSTGEVTGAVPFTGELPGNPTDYVPVSSGGEPNPGGTKLDNGTFISGGSIGTPPIQAAATHMAFMSAGLVAQAQNYNQGKLNSGMFQGSIKAGISKGAETNPVSGVMSSFAAQGGTTAGGGSSPPAGQGAQGDPWLYTNPPQGQAFGSNAPGNFRSGTASGGWVIHPPETDLRDAKTYGMVPPNKTLSSTYLITAPGAWFGAGTPELVSGSLRSGFSWGMDSATGDLLFRSHSFSEPAVNVMRLTNSANTIQWYATKSSYGELTHANTGNRTYTFPDQSGTVALTSGIGNPQSVITTQGDQTVTGTGFTDSTWLTFSVAANTKYYFKFAIQYTVNTLASGAKFQITGPSAPTNVLYWAETTNTSAAVVKAVSGAAFSTDVGYAASTTGTTYKIEIEGTFENGANAGSVTLQFANATALDNITALRDSFVEYSTAV